MWTYCSFSAAHSSIYHMSSSPSLLWFPLSEMHFCPMHDKMSRTSFPKNTSSYFHKVLHTHRHTHRALTMAVMALCEPPSFLHSHWLQPHRSPCCPWNTAKHTNASETSHPPFLLPGLPANSFSSWLKHCGSQLSVAAIKYLRKSALRRKGLFGLMTSESMVGPESSGLWWDKSRTSWQQ
jgi:hypothetical protein